uniref:BZIP domain-containing protein n=1 Tax=Timspurckia oligopyrenoides TaxID=708627 RepID=A0A7S0ZL92_9RHOD|mmetsp:Transcript_9705/g.17491  ORF Transcript_9705/g.17491 Transcript_9705/m.17491 type:complete len:262 (+) Transcript_9705:971-1756(+)
MSGVSRISVHALVAGNSTEAGNNSPSESSAAFDLANRMETATRIDDGPNPSGFGGQLPSFPRASPMESLRAQEQMGFRSVSAPGGRILPPIDAEDWENEESRAMDDSQRQPHTPNRPSRLSESRSPYRPDEEPDKRIRRRLLNRESAQRSRARRALHMDNLMVTVRSLQDENAAIKQQLAIAEEERDLLKHELKELRPSLNKSLLEIQQQRSLNNVKESVVLRSPVVQRYPLSKELSALIGQDSVTGEEAVRLLHQIAMNR